MRKYLIVFCFLAFSIASIAPEYEINLDLPPAQRWNKIIKQNKQNVMNLMQEIKTISNTPFLVKKAIKFLIPHLNYQEYIEEITGIANELALPVEDVVLSNFLYEFRTACTAIVFQTKDGHVQFTKNLDYALAQYIEDLQAVISYTKGGKVLYKGSAIIGMVGLVTGMRMDNGFGITLNQRNFKNKVLGYADVLYGIATQRNPNIWAVRKTLESQENYTSAVNHLKTIPLIANAYLTIAGSGKNEGAIITRSPTHVDLYDELSEQNWFMVQTNTERNVPDPVNDYRRIPAEDKMKEIGQDKITLDAVYKNIMSKAPNYRTGKIALKTESTTLMDPANNSYKIVTYHNVDE